jgi:small conductance mechanosensitive channel
VELARQAVDALRPYLGSAAVLALAVGALLAARTVLRVGGGHSTLSRQLTTLAIVAAALLALILTLPIDEALRGQLLGFIGVILSAALALSSTTFLGNMLAGVMLRIMRNFRPGDFLRVEGHFGRVSARSLLHTEIQTEDRDLTTLPNLYLVTHPMTVIQASGAIVSATVSLGYNVPRTRVESLLLQAAQRSGLTEPFVHLVELGDFAVTYRVAGLLAEVKQILTARSALRAMMLDELHGAGVEIVSPTFMNTRSLRADDRVIPAAGHAEAAPETAEGRPEDVVFDKAEQAESVEKMRLALEELERRIADVQPGEDGEGDRAAAKERKASLRAAMERLRERIETAEKEEREARSR